MLTTSRNPSRDSNSLASAPRSPTEWDALSFESQRVTDGDSTPQTASQPAPPSPTEKKTGWIEALLTPFRLFFPQPPVERITLTSVERTQDWYPGSSDTGGGDVRMTFVKCREYPDLLLSSAGWERWKPGDVITMYTKKEPGQEKKYRFPGFENMLLGYDSLKDPFGD